MKIKELLTAKNVIAKHINDTIPAQLAYKFFKLAKKIDETEEFCRTKILAILDECAEKNEDGNFVQDSNGFKLKPDKIEVWKSKKEEIDEIEVDSVELFSIDELSPLKLSVQDIVNIQKFIKEDKNG